MKFLRIARQHVFLPSLFVALPMVNLVIRTQTRKYGIPVSSYVSTFLDACISFTLCPNPSSPVVALLESKDVLGHFFSGLSNVQLCTYTYVFNDVQPECQV